jgi:hypothetical protein
MMRKRLRPMPTEHELVEMYQVPHDHRRWQDHLFRVDITSAISGLMATPGGSVADLSCGNAAIAERLKKSHDVRLVLGDFAPGYEHTGPIEQTIEVIDPVDLFICSETIEHLDDPEAVLARIRVKTDRLVLSTPDGEDDDRNPEHVWGWDSEEVEKMLLGAGFSPGLHTTVDTRRFGGVYVYQIWAAR